MHKMAHPHDDVVIRDCVRAQLTAFEEKRRKGSSHATDHCILKLDRECGLLKAPQRKRERCEAGSPSSVDTAEVEASALSSSAQRPFFTLVRDALEDVGGEDKTALRAALTQCTKTLQVRHCHLTSACVDDKTSCVDAARTPANSLNTLFFTTPVCSMWAAQLTCLDLECNDLGDEGLRRLSTHVLPRLPLVESVHLASNGVGRAGLEALLSWKRITPVSTSEDVTLPPLRVLGLTNNPLLAATEPSATEAQSLAALLATVLRRWRATIRRVHLNHVGLDAQVVALLLADLASSTHTLQNGFVFPSLDTVYMKQNKCLTRATLKAEAHNYLTDTHSIDEALRFVANHVLLE